MNNTCADYFWLTSSPQMMTIHYHYTQSNLSTDNVPLWTAHTNNYIIKLIVLLNRMSCLPGPQISPIYQNNF